MMPDIHEIREYIESRVDVVEFKRIPGQLTLVSFSFLHRGEVANFLLDLLEPEIERGNWKRLVQERIQGGISDLKIEAQNRREEPSMPIGNGLPKIPKAPDRDAPGIAADYLEEAGFGDVSEVNCDGICHSTSIRR